LKSKPDRKTILVVEDVDEISDLMRSMLRQRGHRTVNAANAAEAIRIAEKNRPDLILTDLDLPTLDGLVRGVRGHDDLNRLLVAVIDINHPDVSQYEGLKILANFDQLDALLNSSN